MTKLFKKIGYQAFGLTDDESQNIAKETSKVVSETTKDANKYVQQAKEADAKAKVAKSEAKAEKERAKAEKAKANAAKEAIKAAKAAAEYAEMKKHAETIKRGKDEVNSILKEWSNRQVNLGSASVSDNTKSWVSDRISDNSVGYNTGNATYARGESYISRLRQR